MAIRMKALQKYFAVVLLIMLDKEVSTFEFVDEIPKLTIWSKVMSNMNGILSRSL